MRRLGQSPWSEMIRMRVTRILAAAAIGLAVLRTGTAWAQAPVPTPWASNNTLLLVDAVQTTIRLSPTVLAAAAQLRQQEALLNVARGPYDPLITAGVS